MNEKNTIKLLNDFPKLYIQSKLPPTQSCMCFGFECGDGWFSLIYNLSKDIQDYIDRNNLNQVEVFQVKEKFGSLCFYIDQGDDYIFDLINKVEKDSCSICEFCGSPGKIIGGGWLMCLCDNCRSKR